MDVVAFVRVSKDSQDTERQRAKILEYANLHNLGKVRFVDIKISTRTKESKRLYLEIIESLREGQDMIIVSDLTRAGRDLVNVVQNVNRIVERNLAFVAIDNAINVELNTEKLDFATKALVYSFAMMGELQRDMISMNTKDKLRSAKARGVKLGRKKGSKGKSKLDGRESEIAELLDKKVPKASIAKIMGVAPTTMSHFIKSRKLEAGGLLKSINE